MRLRRRDLRLLHLHGNVTSHYDAIRLLMETETVVSQTVLSLNLGLRIIY